MDISVSAPIGNAVNRTVLILFKPFNLGKWFVLGFCAWLAYFGERGSVLSFNFGGGGTGGVWGQDVRCRSRSFVGRLWRRSGLPKVKIA